MGNTSGKLADGLHFLGMAELRFQAFQLRNIIERLYCPHHIPIFVHQRRGVAGQVRTLSIIQTR
ncbi:MAG: hypothetical protein A4E58_01956 [Syntrophorhabdus sp. PtaB.Bin006]|nr:MAG: hypothetical protein A4E58_01956 [Syntrophorhabdus sp. PtaB.Bin006]